MFRPIALTRIVFVVLASACGYWIAEEGERDNGAVLACILSLLIVLFEYSLRAVSTKRLVMASLGLLVGLVVSMLVYLTIPESVMKEASSRIACNLFFGYLGVVIALKHADQISFDRFRFVLSNPQAAQSLILDTSVIIDGRIQDVIANDFLPGPIVCPSFVIDELQALADSADPLKRGKGRRGLTILKAIQDSHPSLEIVEKDYPGTREVDRKLLEMAKEMKAKVITNDYNLQKVADLHQVPILNINELADMLKPAVFVGETFSLSIIREGKESGQGVGYLQDGTMVVVDEGNSFISREIPVVVTSILQTNTGRMVFGRPAEPNGNGASANRKT